MWSALITFNGQLKPVWICDCGYKTWKFPASKCRCGRAIPERLFVNEFEPRTMDETITNNLED